VHGVVRLSAWDLAVECVEEALGSGIAPSLERLGRPALLGSLSSFIPALEEDGDPVVAAAGFRTGAPGIGLGPAEIVGELLVLARVLERHDELVAGAAVDRCLVGDVEGLARRPHTTPVAIR
jgi:hypothetical protein